MSLPPDFRQQRPFNFMGHFSETQFDSLKSWIEDEARAGQNSVTEFHRIRAQQLRKTAGVLEDFYASKRGGLKPTFNKAPWKPPTGGHFQYVERDDSLPASAMFDVKELLRDQLKQDDDGVFAMNHLRTQIERHEDAAEEANESDTIVKARLEDIERYFKEPQYVAVLVQDKTDPEHTYRVNQREDPTSFERALIAHKAQTK
jgi:hypothetical protein